MLQVEKVSFAYDEVNVLEKVNLTVETGQHVSIIGASGCGKSTLLQSIYGIHDVQGSIHWNGLEIKGPRYNLVPGAEFMKYLSQDFDLMPSISVAENVGKFLSNMYPRKKKQRVKALLDLVEMGEFSAVKAKSLSGGQQQRVALARVLAKPPEILLLDEPFSHIDQFRKNRLRRQIFTHLKSAGITVITATHDSTDALSFADKTVVMENGRIVTSGKPQELYEDPQNGYLASLLGEVNELPAALFKKGAPAREKLILYPHDFELLKESPCEAIVKQVLFRGSHFLVVAIYRTEEVLIEVPREYELGDRIRFKIPDALLEKRAR